MDWNLIVGLLHELGDGMQPLSVLRHAMSRHDHSALLQSLLFLADRSLIELSDHPDAPQSIAESEWRRRIEFALEGRGPVWIDLTPNGEQVLRLLGIRHP